MMEAIADKELLIFTIRGDTMGSHGFGDVDEFPAAFPCPNATWEFELEKLPQIEPLLKGLTVIMEDSSGGSYHERWCRADVYVIVPYDPMWKIEDAAEKVGVYLGGPNHDRRAEKTTFRFESFAQVAKEVAENLGGKVPNNMALPGEDREEYWARQRRQAYTPSDYRYGPPGRDRPWDGD